MEEADHSDVKASATEREKLILACQKPGVGSVGYLLQYHTWEPWSTRPVHPDRVRMYEPKQSNPKLEKGASREHVQALN
jgi:hypothetical protein